MSTLSPFWWNEVCRRLLREGVFDADGEAVCFDTKVRAAATSESESSSTLFGSLETGALIILTLFSNALPVWKRGVRLPTGRLRFAVWTHLCINRPNYFKLLPRSVSVRKGCEDSPKQKAMCWNISSPLKLIKKVSYTTVSEDRSFLKPYSTVQQF